MNLHSQPTFLFCCCVASLLAFHLEVARGQEAAAAPESPPPAASESSPPPAKTQCEISLEGLKKRLSYAEDRAQNAESELKVLQKMHDSSVEACRVTSSRQAEDLDKCRNDTAEWGKRLNASETERVELRKEVLQLRSKTATADALNGDVQKLREEAAAAKKKAADLEVSEKLVKAELDKLAAEKQNVLKELEKKKAEAESERYQKDEYAKQFEKVTSDLRSKATSAETQDAHMFSKDILFNTVTSVYGFYKSVGTYIVSFVPEEALSKVENTYADAKAAVQGYMKSVQPYMETVSTVAIKQYGIVSSLYETHLGPIVNKQAETAGGWLSVLLSKGAAATGACLNLVNEYIDGVLQDFFVAHPHMRTQIPSSLFDRILCLIFVLVMPYFGFIVLRFGLRCVVLPILGSLCVCCRKRRSAKSTKVQKGNKKFTPATTTVQGGKKSKDGNFTSNTPTVKKATA